MFSKRKDGRLIKGLDPIFRMIPHIMRRRTGAQVFCKRDFFAQPVDDYIRAQRQKGYDLTYMSVVLTAYLRTMAQRPSLNRFIINGRIYARDEYVIAITIKKTLTDESDEILLKLHFKGTENIYEVNDIIVNEIKKNREDSADNLTESLAGKFMSLPNGTVKRSTGLLMKFDDWNMMPKAVLEASPFHASAFLTNMKSIKQEYVYHHLYDFGSCSVFISLGKVSERAASVKGKVISAKMFTLGFTVDERICDGFYLTKSFKVFETYMKDLPLLEENLTATVMDID